jgi:hypothetical protein
MHGYAKHVLIGLLQFGQQCVGKGKCLLLLRCTRFVQRIHGAHPFSVDR